MAKVITSKKFTLQWRDAIKGLIVAALTAPITTIYDSLSAGELDINWGKIGASALAGGLAYVLKNWLIEPPKVITVTDTNTKAENAAERVKEVV